MCAAAQKQKKIKNYFGGLQ